MSDNVREDEPSARSEHAPCLAEDGLVVTGPDVQECLAGNAQVHAVRGDRGVHVALAVEGQAGILLRQPGCSIDHLAADIHAYARPDHVVGGHISEEATVATAHVHATDLGSSIVRFDHLHEALLLELLRLANLGEQARIREQRVGGDEVVPSHVGVVLPPHGLVKRLRVLVVVIIPGRSHGAVLGGHALEPQEHPHAHLGNVVDLRSLAQLRLDDVHVDVQARHPPPHVLRRRPLGLVRRPRLDPFVLPIHVLVREVERAAQVGILAVVSHDAVGEHAPVPVRDDDASLNAGHDAHLFDDRVAYLLRHDHDGVVRAYHEGGLVLLVVSHVGPPLVELHGVCDVEFEAVVDVGLLAVVDEVLVDVHADAGRAGSLEEADDLAGAAAHLDHDVVGVTVARLDDAAAGVVVQIVEDRVLVANGVLPGVDGEVLPELGLVVEGAGAEGRVGSHDGY
mmetsp:Transcript_11478/g.28272  ORF Transcript_11478/g.28272 Transcript_11478/m.28272 type:complete len:453 (+) Transcript_11478:865-2223(+)